MSIVRSALLRASRSAWLAEQFRRRAFARRAVRRFMPGEDLGDALNAAASSVREGLGSVVTCLGERVASPEAADEVRAHYVGVLEQIRARALPTHLSVKLTHLGLEVDAEQCTASVRALAAAARDAGTFLWIDIEESQYVDRTIELYRRVRADHANVGLCLQAYLRRTSADLDVLLAEGAAIRLVKGAYREPVAIAFEKKRDVDAAYEALAGRMLEAAASGAVSGPAVFGTHDLALITRIRQRAETIGVPRYGWEVHMLYGIRAVSQRALASSGVVVRVLISYGSNWFPWYVRRLAERPANLWFVVRSVVS